MSLASTEYPEGVNEFIKAGFTMLSSEKVRPFRVEESPIQLECKVINIVELGTEGGAGNLIICEVVKLHIKEEILDQEGAIDQSKLDLVARAGGSLYSRVRVMRVIIYKNKIIRFNLIRKSSFHSLVRF